jgi:threonine/homoserine/homoserine lactone efflux protein
MVANALLRNSPPLVIFMVVMSITPGPNNLMLLSAGARFGLRRTVPHLLGITIGFLLVLLVTYAGVGAIILTYPSLKNALTVACVLYLLWLGYQLLRHSGSDDAAAVKSGNVAGRPLTVTESTLFQLVNPKAWGAAVPAIGIVARDGLSPTYGLILLLGVGLIVGPPCILLWTLFGASVRPFLAIRWIHRLFYALMSALILATAWWMLLPLFAR